MRRSAVARRQRSPAREAVLVALSTSTLPSHLNSQPLLPVSSHFPSHSLWSRCLFLHYIPFLTNLKYLNFYNLYIFSTWWCKPLCFPTVTMLSVRIHILKYLRLTTSGYNDIGIRILECEVIVHLFIKSNAIKEACIEWNLDKIADMIAYYRCRT